MSETEQSSSRGATDEALVLAASAEGKWQQLPESLRRDLGQTMPDAETLCNLCLDGSEWRGLIASFAADAAELDRSVRVIQALLAQVSASAVLRRKRRAAVHPSLQWLSVLKQARTSVPATAPVHSLEWLLRSGAKMRTRFREPKGPACSRAEKELAAVTRWRGKFADILADASVPALRDVPADMAHRWALKLAGSSRSRTLKKHIQMWQRYAKWLLASFQVTWPSSEQMVVDFIDELGEQPCGRSVPAAFLATLAFFERAADIPVDHRLSRRSIITMAIEQLSSFLDMDAEPPRKARPQPFMLILALELWVLHEDASRYSRALAWAKLVKFWSSSRCDDLLGLVPSTMELDSQGLRALLGQTKSSGPGKKVRWLPVFVDVGASFSGLLWLQAGFEIWQSEDFNFERDFLLPLPSRDWSSCCRHMADYAAVSAITKILYQQLRAPAWQQDGWYLRDIPLLCASSSPGAWTEHSKRCWLISAAVLLEIDDDQCKFLGRWRVTASHHEYIRTAARAVGQVQRRVVQAAGSDNALAEIGLKELELFLRQAGHGDSVINEQLDLLSFPTWDVSPPMSVPDAGTPVVLADAETPVDVESGEPVSFKYFVCISRNRRYRRLHRWGACGSKPNFNISEFEGFDSLDGLQYDSACKHCWPGGIQQDDGAASDSSVSTDASLHT